MSDKLASSRYHVVCSRDVCGFRVHERYFEEKQRFPAGVCPRCGAPILVVKPYTRVVVNGATMRVDGTIEGV